MALAYQPLHHKYRPQRFDQLVGQEAIATTLANALRTGRIAPAYLFSGPRGTGKTSSARILARSLNCLSSGGPTPDPCGTCALCTTIAAGNALDVIEIDAASNTGVDNIRELIERSRFAPVQARWKVYVVDECHMLSTAAFNALLKTLEEPPPHVVFILATTDPQRVLPTILSRCQRFDFRRIPLEALQAHLRWIADQEEIGISEEALHVVAQRAQGGLRDAESLLDQLSLLPPPVEPAAVWDLLGAVPEEELLALAEAMGGGDPLRVVETCRDLLDRGREPGAVLQGLTGLLRDLLLAGVAPDRLELTSVTPGLRERLPAAARTIGKERLLRWQAQLKGSEQQLRGSMQPRLWLEVLVLGLLAEPLAVPAAAPRAPVAAGRVDAGSMASGPASGHTGTSGPAEAGSASLSGSASPSMAAPSGNGGSGEKRSAAWEAGPPEATPGAQNLPELWQQILAGLELPSTRMLLSQQAELVRLDGRKAVVRVNSNWIAMVQSRLPLLEKAMRVALGEGRSLELEAGESHPLPRSTAGPYSSAPSVPPSPSERPTETGSTPASRAMAAAAPIAPRSDTSEARPAAGPPKQGSTPPSSPTGAEREPCAAGRADGHHGDAFPSPSPRPEVMTTESAQPEPGPFRSDAAGGTTPPDGEGKEGAGSARPASPGGHGDQLDEQAHRLAEFFNGEVIR